jgi:hypothetical protein
MTQYASREWRECRETAFAGFAEFAARSPEARE